MKTQPVPTVAKLLRDLGIRRVTPDKLTIRRKRQGTGFTYHRPNGSRIKDAATIKRYGSLAVPPAYEDVRYAEDVAAHIQATGTDAAGRTQYRYHPDWLKVREVRKAHRLMQLVAVMPKVRRAIAKSLSERAPTRSMALAAVIDLVVCSAIRAGSESYAREHGTRGATTLLKSNVAVEGKMIVLSFKGKLGKVVNKELRSPRLAGAIKAMRTLPGRRLFQYRDEQGEVRLVRRSDANAFLRDIAGVKISLKDFRTLVASDLALANLAKAEPAESERGRKGQIRVAVQAAADELTNTATICRKSYVHASIVDAFENGGVEKFAVKLGNGRSRVNRELVLAQILASAQAV